MIMDIVRPAGLKSARATTAGVISVDTVTFASATNLIVAHGALSPRATIKGPPLWKQAGGFDVSGLSQSRQNPGSFSNKLLRLVTD
jgi:hypothetical protein